MERRKVDGYLCEISEDKKVYVRDVEVSSNNKRGIVKVVSDDDYSMKSPKALRLHHIAFPELAPGVVIDGYENRYSIDRDGNVYSLITMKYIKHRKFSQGNSKTRIIVELVLPSGKKKAELLHRLIAKMFISNPEDKPEVNHKDGNPSNNNIGNLEWATKKENTEHAKDNYLYGSSQKSVVVSDKNDILIGTYVSMQQAADTLGMKSKHANKNISETCAKNASKDLINSRHPLGLFMSEGYVFKFPV